MTHVCGSTQSTPSIPDRPITFCGPIHLTLAQPRINDTGKEDQLRHEIGHFIGLDEAYNESGFDSCAYHIQSVMNGAFTSNGQNCVGVHAPTTRDINAVDAYWDAGTAESLVLTARPSYILKATWTDAAWAEHTHWVSLFYKDETANDWVMVYHQAHKDDIGFHKNTINRTIQKEWNVQSQGWPTDKKYIVGVTTFSWPYNRWSTYLWSHTVWPTP